MPPVPRDGREQKHGERRRAQARAPWGTVSRAQVVAAAIELVGEGRYEQMTIRSLAARLGVAPMTLYRHVESKDDLLDQVADWFLAKSWQPQAPREDWKAWLEEAAVRLRDLLISQPAVLYVFLSHPVVTPVAIERMDATLQVLKLAGFKKRAAEKAYAAVHTYTVGFAALEASRARSATKAHGATPLEEKLASFTTSRQYGEGLKYLLAGIQHDRSQP